MNELSFLDIAILRKIDAESSVEKFGSMINTSFFETANLLGTTKIKGYINIESSVGGISKVTITDAGSSILAVADQRSKEPVEPLDNAILHAVAGGSRELDALQSALGIRSADLAYHLNKLVAQNFMDYEMKSAKVYFVLTEMGFNATGGVRVQQTLPPQEQPKQPEAESGAAAKPEARAATPPWVKPSDVKTAVLQGKTAPIRAAGPNREPEHKPDVAHILKDEAVEKREKAHKENEKEKPHVQPKRPLTPEEEEASKKMKRVTSKIEYYLVEYAPYIIMIIVLIAIFSAVILFGLTKLG